MKANKVAVLCVCEAVVSGIDKELLGRAFDSTLARATESEKGKTTYAVNVKAATKNAGTRLRLSGSQSGELSLSVDARTLAWAIREVENGEAYLGTSTCPDDCREWLQKFVSAQS